MLRINRENLRKSKETPWLVLDLVMLGLLLVNLLWLIFDALYETSFVHSQLSAYAPGLVNAYQPIHRNFLLVDLAFITVFFAEFCFRWAVSLARKEHLRWYFFPFLHWYDLVGLIPLTATRIFRFLRIFSILHRLHKYQIIDLNRTAAFRFFAFYYDVFLEELSDRIVVKILADAQKDIAAGSPLINDITHRVLTPRRPLLTQWLAGVLNQVGESVGNDKHSDFIRQHVRASVGKAVRANRQLGNLQYLPIVGKTIESTLEQAVSDIVTATLINLLTDLDAKRIDDFVTTSIKSNSPNQKHLDKEVLTVINECLELIKAHVAQQRWKSGLMKREQAMPVSDSQEEHPLQSHERN